MSRLISLEDNIAITSADRIIKIVNPISKALDILFFRYLKLYKDGSRILLSTNPDALRFMYQPQIYKRLWYDGARSEFLTPGWHPWAISRLLDPCESNESLIAHEMHQLLGVQHGLTFVCSNATSYEIYSFDTATPSIYAVDLNVLTHFIYHFKDQARKIIKEADAQRVLLPDVTPPQWPHKNPYTATEVCKQTPIKRYYLTGCYEETYLTETCRWLSKPA